MTGIRRRQADKQGDPLEKKGIVGAFCRTYTIPQAIGKFLPDVYTATAKPDRYTYAAGSTAAGLVVYDGELFAFSNHSTDPAGGQLCNAFDLVRIHKFGHLDEDAAPDASGKKLPSFHAMTEFAANDPDTKRRILEENRQRAVDDFSTPTEEDAAADSNWQADLDMSDKGVLVPNARNALLILRHDPKLQGIRYNELSGAVEAPMSLPWNRQNKYWYDVDDAQLYMWVSVTYRVNFTDKIFQKAFATVTNERRFNPLREYICGLPEWDGVPRVDTLFIDYLGADDTEYTRAVTRKSLVGAINRVLQPGCKFDTVLVLDGKPGIGKSTILQKLGGQWFQRLAEPR